MSLLFLVVLFTDKGGNTALQTLLAILSILRCCPSGQVITLTIWFASHSIYSFTGLVIYFWSAKPDEQGVLDPQRPKYVRQARGSEPVPQDLESTNRVAPTNEE
jgi:hypothetical protein